MVIFLSSAFRSLLRGTTGFFLFLSDRADDGEDMELDEDEELSSKLPLTRDDKSLGFFNLSGLMRVWGAAAVGKALAVLSGSGVWSAVYSKALSLVNCCASCFNSNASASYFKTANASCFANTTASYYCIQVGICLTTT